MKKTLIHFLATIILFSTLNGQALDSAKSKEKEVKKTIPSKSVIRGRVFYEDTGSPVRRGKIGLFEVPTLKKTNGVMEAKKFVGADFVYTNSYGEFEIRNIKVGNYYPFVDVQNVINPQTVNRNFEDYNEMSIPVLKNYFQKIKVDGTSEIQIFIPVKRGGVVSGQVYYQEGGLARGVMVEVLRFEDDGFSKDSTKISKTLTDDRGTYRLTGLLPGKYKIKVSEAIETIKDWNISTEEGFKGSQLIVYYPKAVDIEKAELVDVGLGEEAKNLDVIIPDRKIFKVSGTVIAKDSRKPLENISLNLSRVVKSGENRSSTFSGENTSNTDKFGKWSFNNLPNGVYKIWISQFSRYGEIKKGYAQFAKEIKIENSEVNDIVIELPRESSLSGIVRIAGNKKIPDDLGVYASEIDSNITSFDSFSEFIGTNKPKKDQIFEKKFKIGNLPPGNYSLFHWAEENLYIKSIKIGRRDITNSFSFKLKENENKENIEIILADDMGTLKGRLLSGDAPKSGRYIHLVPTKKVLQGSSKYFIGKTDINGEFEFKAAPGEYFVTFPRSEYMSLPFKERIGKQIENAEIIEIKANKIKHINLKFPE